MKLRVALVGLILLICLPLVAQNFISAKAGIVNYEEGRQLSSPRQLHEGEYFSEPNRTELLLTPGSFLRLERNAEIQMLSTRLSEPAVELVSGVASLEIMDLPKETKVRVAWGEYKDDRALEVDHKGIYRFEVAGDGSAMLVMVEKGELRMGGGSQTIKEGQQATLTADSIGPLAKFDKKLRDDFDVWNAERSELLGVASYRAAQGVSSYGSGYMNSLYGMGGYGYPFGYAGYAGMYPGMGMWAFNPYFGYFTYVGFGNSLWMSPWGSYFYTPATWYYYQPPYGANGGGVQTAVGTLPSKPIPSPRLSPTGNNSSNSGIGRSFGSASPSSTGMGSSGGMSAGGMHTGGGATSGGGGSVGRVH